VAAQHLSFGVQLRFYRYRAGLSQAALAGRAGLSEAAISALERGVHGRPYPHTLDRLASALRLTPAERAALVEETPVSGGRAVDVVDAHSDPSGSSGAPPHAPSSHTLPSPLTSFVGRERELAVAAGLLAAGFRLLTLTGPGGSGKTRLAIEGARAVSHNFPAGVWFVDLAPLPLHGDIERTVAAALGVLGWVAEAKGDHVEAERLMERSLAAAQAARSPTDVVLQLNNLGILALRRGDAEVAEARYREALRCGHDVDAHEPVACSLEGLGGVAAARGQYDRAARLLGAAVAVRLEIAAPRIAQFEEEHHRVVPGVRMALGEQAFAAAQAEGEAWPAVSGPRLVP
jgi:transcriptional regulator with XRE-family HTH domain